MDKLKINKTSSKDDCPKCLRYQKHLAKLRKAFISADDENVRRCMLYEATIRRFNAEHNSDKSKQKSGVRKGCRASF